MGIFKKGNETFLKGMMGIFLKGMRHFKREWDIFKGMWHFKRKLWDFLKREWDIFKGNDGKFFKGNETF